MNQNNRHLSPALLAAFLFALSTLTLLAGCSPKGAEKPSGIAEQQKGVMGGTPPPGEMEKIKAMQAQQQQTQAAEQAKEQSAAAAKGGK